MRDIPPELLSILEDDDCGLSQKALLSYIRHEYSDEDAAQIARTGYVHKKESDEERESDYVWTLIGHDRAGTATYMAGKVVRRHGYKTWFIITIHPADPRSCRLRRR